MSTPAFLFVKTTTTTTKQKQKKKKKLFLFIRANHLHLVSNLQKTSKNKKRQHPRRNGTGAENAIDLPQVDLARIPEHNVLATKA